MKKLMIISLALVSMFTRANAQLLYKISGKDLKSPSYIVGTIIWHPSVSSMP